MPGSILEIRTYEPAIGLVREPRKSVGGSRPFHQTFVAALFAAAINAGLVYVLTADLGWGIALSASRSPMFEVDVDMVRAVLIEDPAETPAPPMLAQRRTPGPVVGLPRRSKGVRNGTASRNKDAPSHVLRDDSQQSDIERLQGIYRAQISARLERSLEEAKVLLGRHCVVRIDQSAGGTIIALATDRCDAGDGVRPRLMTAIFQASPLPAPPRGDIFQSRLVVELGKQVKVR